MVKATENQHTVRPVPHTVPATTPATHGAAKRVRDLVDSSGIGIAGGAAALAITAAALPLMPLASPVAVGLGVGGGLTAVALGARATGAAQYYGRTWNIVASVGLAIAVGVLTAAAAIAFAPAALPLALTVGLWVAPFAAGAIAGALRWALVPAVPPAAELSPDRRFEDGRYLQGDAELQPVAA